MAPGTGTGTGTATGGPSYGTSGSAREWKEMVGSAGARLQPGILGLGIGFRDRVSVRVRVRVGDGDGDGDGDGCAVGVGVGVQVVELVNSMRFSLDEVR